MMMNILIQNQNSTSHVTAIITGHILILVIHRTISVHEKIHSSELVIPQVASSALYRSGHTVNERRSNADRYRPRSYKGPPNSEQSMFTTDTKISEMNEQAEQLIHTNSSFKPNRSFKRTVSSAKSSANSHLANTFGIQSGCFLAQLIKNHCTFGSLK